MSTEILPKITMRVAFRADTDTVSADVELDGLDDRYLGSGTAPRSHDASDDPHLAHELAIARALHSLHQGVMARIHEQIDRVGDDI